MQPDLQGLNHQERSWEIAMIEASSAEVQKDFRGYREKAEGGEAVVVLHYNKPSVVILSAGEYARLRRRDKRVMLNEELPQWLVDRIAETEMDPKFAHLDEGL
jgi:PHD/YefM family antitoxin component YafN of YafNO toxin-antitoxin module